MRSALFAACLCVLSAAALVGCAAGASETQNVVEFRVAAPPAQPPGGAFLGFGAEWDPFYWNQNNQRRGADEAGWALATARIRELKMPITRMMMQLRWCQSDPDLTAWSWDNPQMQSVFRYLDFCQANDVQVMLADWGWAVQRREEFRLYDSPADERYARGIAGYLKEFIERRGYTCIRWLVVGNEPNLEIVRRHSLDAYVEMYRNVDAALREAGLRDRVGLTGPDSAGLGSYYDQSIEKLAGLLDAFDFHLYAKWEDTRTVPLEADRTTLWQQLTDARARLNARDASAAAKPLMIGEMGLGPPGMSTNGHERIGSYDYALHMADMGTTILQTPIQAGIAWCLQDIYYFEYSQFMTWGLWRYKDADWALRPWAHSFGLLIRHAPRGSRPAAVNGSPPADPGRSLVRCAAVVRPDGKWSLFLVNRGESASPVRLHLPSTPAGPLSLYRVQRDTFAQYAERIALPPTGEVAPAAALGLTLPGESFTVLVE